MNFQALLFVAGLVMFISAADVVSGMPPDATFAQWVGVLAVGFAGFSAMFLSNARKD